MREFRLNRWQRIFLVLSIIWIVIGGSWGWRHAYDQVDADFKTCVAAVKTASDLESCRETRNAAIAIPRGVHAAIVAFGPLLIVWLAVYGPILLLRRSRRRSHASTSAEQVMLAPVQEASAIVDGGRREGAAMTDEAPGRGAAAASGETARLWRLGARHGPYRFARDAHLERLSMDRSCAPDRNLPSGRALLWRYPGRARRAETERGRFRPRPNVHRSGVGEAGVGPEVRLHESSRRHEVGARG